MAYSGVSFKNNKEQQELIRLIYENNKPIVFCVGKAGTGKTMATLAAALQLKSDKRYHKIIYVRDSIPVGHDIGSLPGTADEKMSPYWGPVYDSLEAIAKLSNKEHYNIKDMASKIEVLPLAFLRGRNFCNSIIIIDEAQNLDLNALKTVITRADRWSKVVFLGSCNQIDDWRQRTKSESDFQRVMNKLADSQWVGSVELIQSMRAPWTVEIDNLLGELENHS